jgi:hypothetical protein
VVRSWLLLALTNSEVHCRSSLTNVSYVMSDDLCEQLLQTFDAVLAGWPFEHKRCEQ